MKIQVKTNRTSYQPEHRLELDVKEVREFVFPRFGYWPRSARGPKMFKVIPWTGKNGLMLHYKKNTQEPAVVGFEEPGYGVAETYYTLNELEDMMMPF